MLGLAGGLLTTACEKTGDPQTRSRQTSTPVQICPVESNTTPSIEKIPGTVRAKLRASIEAKMSARVEKMSVVEGQEVRAGQVLAQLDVREV